MAPVLLENAQDLRWPSVLLFFYILIPKILFVGLETFFFLLLLFFVFIWWIASREKFPAELGQIIGPLFLILLVGMLGIADHARYDVAKDIWYISNAVLALAAGYVLMRNMQDLRRFFSIFIIASFIVAILHLIRFALDPALLSMNANEIRTFAGEGYFEPGLGLTLILVAKMMGLKVFSKNSWFILLATLFFVASVALSFSRTQIVSLVLIWLAVFGWIHFNNMRKMIIWVVVVAIVVGIGISLPNQEFADTSMLDKFMFSFQEIKFANYISMREINEHWRGYESYRALETYLLGSPWQYLVGSGFGTNVDLGLLMDLGGEKMRFAPILHNGYMYLLVKTGIIGLLLYLHLLFNIIRKGTSLSFSDNVELKYCGRLIVGLGLSFAVTTFVISGMFNKFTLLSMSILLGGIIAYCSGKMDLKKAARVHFGRI